MHAVEVDLVDVLVNACCLRPACLCYVSSQVMHHDEICGSQRGTYVEAGLRFTELELAWTTRPTLHGS